MMTINVSVCRPIYHEIGTSFVCAHKEMLLVNDESKKVRVYLLKNSLFLKFAVRCCCLYACIYNSFGCGNSPSQFALLVYGTSWMCATSNIKLTYNFVLL